jgi:hypothetical protein
MIKECINIKVDHLEKQESLHAHSSKEFFDGCFPSENFWVYANGQKITSPTKQSLESHWGRAEAKHFFDFKLIVHSSDFDLIWWLGMELAIASF